MKNKKAIVMIGASVLLVSAILLALFFGGKLYKNHLIELGYRDTPNTANQCAKSVTMVQLIANPEKYDGELVRVIGVGNLELEGNCLSLSKEDLQYGVGNRIWLELGERAIPYEEAKAYNGKYVIVEGFFDKDDTGHMGDFRGAIKNISRYQLWEGILQSETEPQDEALDLGQ